MYQTGGTIRETLEEIGSGNFVLPAIQREFVWKPAQICKFYDSLMQGYPFGTFLYWRITTENVDKFKFYEFMRHYHERDKPHCTPIEDISSGTLTAVLDGQQRLTALNIGLRGTMAWKLPNRWWNNASAFPKRILHLDLLGSEKPDENGIRYNFAFLSPDQLDQKGSEHCWFPVPSIMKMKEGPEMLDWLMNEHLPQDQTKEAFKILNQLFQVTHNLHLVAFYEEKSQELERVLNIFIRMNSGGTVLSYSDLLLSIAVAQWSKHDARDEIHTLVDELNRIGDGFEFSKDLVLKAGLMLSDIGNVGFKVENFNKVNMAKLESKWNSIKDALLLTVQLLSSFGFNGQAIRADSAILPIAYYIHSRKLGEEYLKQTVHEQDREAIRSWFIKSLLKAGIWGSGLDTLLTALRETIRDHGSDRFPYNKIRDVMTRRSKSISFEAEEIEQLADMTYGDNRLFALLSLIFPFLKHEHIHHVDHVFPKGNFTNRNLRKAGTDDADIEDMKDASDKLANLQLLHGAVNNEKRKKMPLEWLSETIPNSDARQEYIQRYMLKGVSNDLNDFSHFYNQRRSALILHIGKVLNVKPSDNEANASGEVSATDKTD